MWNLKIKEKLKKKSKLGLLSNREQTGGCQRPKGWVERNG